MAHSQTRTFEPGQATSAPILPAWRRLGRAPPFPVNSGGKRAAISKRFAKQITPGNREAPGVRWLQHRFRAGEEYR